MKEKITDKHFKLFQAEFKKWQKKLCLELEWQVKFHFGLKNTKYKNAYIDKDLDNGVADVYFDKDFDYKLTCDGNLLEGIRLAAKHEAIHLLLERLSVYGKWRWTTEEQYINALEDVVRKLTKLL